ncbi:MAG: Undecaprenyl-diphosphatase [Opitutia bacterium UBA7350]|nr:MAG: Undecaprenyl-diphosphatase [Opitutae bacterium UBA7350]
MNYSSYRQPINVLLAILALSAPSLVSAETSDEDPKPQFTYLDAAILGIVEGITEYLPVSSTGHLIITNAVLGLDSSAPLPDSDGNILWIKDSAQENGQRPFTLENAADAYVIIIQFGAILAVVVLYRRRLLSILMGVLGKDPNGLRILLNLMVAFLPAVILGLLLDELIESALFGIYPVVIALITGAFLMLAVEHWHRKKKSSCAESGPDLHELTLPQCLGIGLLQCIAMWPGTSRSMMTIVGGYLVGLRPARAAEFSFLLGLITLSAASAYKTLSVGPYIIQTVPIGPLLLGILVAAVFAALAVKWLVHFLTHHGLGLFAWYRLGLAAIVLITLN